MNTMRLAWCVIAAAVGCLSGCGREDLDKSTALAPQEAESPAFPEPQACAADMVWIHGQYCPKPKQRCVEHLAGAGSLRQPPCVAYEREPRCSGKRQRLSFCIERHEHRAPGSELPQNQVSLSQAQGICGSEGKRLCSFAEWVFACEGEEMRPFPYGFEEDKQACHTFETDLKTARGQLADHREAVGTRARCVSPFGVRDMVGNIQEHVIYEAAQAGSALMGSYWQPKHAACRDAQTAHDRHYRGVESGFRCCSDVSESARAEPGGQKP
jgi:hypothetical protein